MRKKSLKNLTDILEADEGNTDFQNDGEGNE